MVQNDLPLIHAIIDALLFLEHSTDDEVDPDLAVRCMENMSASLHALTQADQIALRSRLEKIAEESPEPRYRDFVRALPDHIDLAGSETKHE